MTEPGSTEMRDRGALGWAARTGRGGDGRAEARPFTPRPGAHRPGAGPAGDGTRTGSGLASPDGRTARADRWIQAEAIVRTVLRDLPPGELGPCDAHEHLFLATPQQPGEEFAGVDEAIIEAGSLHDAGGRALIDWTPIGLGRDLDGLVRVSRETGVHIVAATGLHRDAHYRADDPLRTTPTTVLAERFVADIMGGPVRCGIVKAGASYHRVQPFERLGLEAAAEAHRRTGAPICVHTEHGTNGLGLVELLGALEVPASSVVLAHLDRNPDAGEHAETGATGAWLQLDGPGRTRYWPDSTILALIADLAERGLASRLLVGGDTGRRSMMRAYGGGPGLDYVFRRFKPRLERELGSELAQRIFAENPARAFAFAPRGED